MNMIEVVIAENEFFTRRGICDILKNEPNIRVVGEAENGDQAIEMVLALEPRVLLLDIHMPPGIDGVEVIRRLRVKGSQVLIIALTEDKGVIKSVQRAGANGFLPKDKYQMFIPTVQCVAGSGSQVFINPEVSEQFKALSRRVERAELSELDFEVWSLIGFKNGEIADRLCKSPGRIRNVVAELYFKLEIEENERLTKRMQAYKLAELYGILREPATNDM